MEVSLVIFALVVVALGLYLLARRRRIALPDDPDSGFEDPDAGVPVRVKTGPGGKSGATALVEPDEDETI
jgi:hypothetical protein